VTGGVDLLVIGDVRTMRADGARAGALAARGGRIVAVGRAVDLVGMRGGQTLVLDAGSRTVLPGLIDAHGHFGHVARSMATAVDCRTPPVKAIADILERGAARSREVPPGTWILLQGTTFQDELLAERRFPTPAELSAVSADRPIVYRSSIHHLVLNRCALRMAGIGRDTPEHASARIERDGDGEPTGVLAEMFDQLPLPPLSEPELAASISRVAWGDYLANGVTSIQEIWDSALVMRLLGRAVAGGEIPLRVRGYGWVPLAGSVAEVASGAIADAPLTPEWFEGGGVKLFVDGGTSAHTAAFYDEYLDDAPNNRGALAYQLEQLTAHIAEAHATGAQVALHAAGDLAQDISLAALELASVRPELDLRPRIEHGANTAWTAWRSQWCRRLGVLPVPNLGFIYNYGEFWPRSLGERGRGCVPLRTLLQEGFPIPSSSDTTGGDPRLLNPFHNIWCAVTRRTFTGRTIDPEQRITREQGLAMYTRHAAHAGFWEDSRGTLEPGKMADVVVLDSNLDAVADEELDEIGVEHTIVGGRVVYSAH
jgi:predicted amidohydrolase YtcJ